MVRWYFAGLALSFFGTSAMHLVAGVWVKSLTGSDALATIAILCVYAPGVLSPWIGRIADSYRRKPLLICTDLAIVPVLAVLFLTDEIWVIYTVLLIYGVKAVLVSAAEPALLVALLPPDRLARINGLRMSLQEGMKLVAPLAAAALFAGYGAWPVIAIDALSFLLAAAATSMIKVDEPPPAPRETPSRPHLKALTWPIAGAATALFAGSIGTAASFSLVENGLHHDPEFLGVLSAAQGAGSVIAGLQGKRANVTAGLVLVAAGALARTTAWLPAVLAGGFLNGAGLAWAVIAVATLVQQRTPPAVLGRVSATAISIVFAGGPLGLAAGAALVAHLSFEAIYVIIAVITTAAAVWARGSQARRFTARRAPARATDQME
ncbi:MFS transporter [Lentzea flava]|uniref:MFS transporter n=1 Tax=Lentzea flava TaxID=103732 RepID=A0ABQ2UMP7_9PSEU|nr:MFS transporter [Lentzea flava]MCP2200419.1 putative arabinose efflux permease, MFS family [Lentzea flava]GGU42721.1 MFS transporter [Lentzea flava]